MNSKRLKLVVPRITQSTRAAEVVRLDQWLAEQVSVATDQAYSKGQIRKLLQAGAVYLNGKQVRIASKPLIPGAVIEVFLDPNRVISEPVASADLSVMTLYRDQFIWLVNKPAGLPTQPTMDPKRPNLYHYLISEEKKRLDEAGDRRLPYVGLHHRLDRDTSGVVLFTVAESANKRIADIFKNHEIQKTYECLVSGVVQKPGLHKEEWTTESYLKPYKVSAKLKKMKSVTSGGDYAKTEFKVLSRFSESLAHLQASPMTGRMHQIRIHAADSGCSLLGDPVYGGPTEIEHRNEKRKIKRVMLHARSIEFSHPVSGQSMKVEAPLPDDLLELKKWLER